MKKFISIVLLLLVFGFFYYLFRPTWSTPGQPVPETTAPVPTIPPTLPPTMPPTLPPTEPEPTEPEISEFSEKTRPVYNLGTCRGLDREAQFVLIYLDDAHCSWDENSIEDFYTTQISKGIRFIQEEAARWDVDLQLGQKVFRTDDRHSLLYDGVVNADFRTDGTTQDILEQVSQDLGYGSKEKMHSCLQDQLGHEQLVYLIFLNKDGYSYSNQDQIPDGNEEIEYAVIFRHYLGSTYDSGAATVAHETLHLFGAEDYYDPYGTLPHRAKLAEQFYHDDIMMRTYTDVTYNTIDSVTAYSIGWTQEVPDIVTRDEWWK